MLGVLISESHGRAIGVRVLDEYGTIEQSGQQNGTLLDIDCTATVTLTSAPRSDTTWYGEDVGIAVTRDGDYVTFKTILIGFIKGQTVHYRGARYYRTDAPKLARLSNIVGAYEGVENEYGTYQIKIWEWE